MLREPGPDHHCQSDGAFSCGFWLPVRWRRRLQPMGKWSCCCSGFPHSCAEGRAEAAQDKLSLQGKLLSGLASSPGQASVITRLSAARIAGRAASAEK